MILLPIGDEPNPPKPQWVNRIVIALNVAIFVLIALPLEAQPFEPNAPRTRERQAELDQMWRASGAWVIRQGGSRAMWEGSLTEYSFFTNKFGYKPGAPSLKTLLLCMFLHGGIAHLLGNMLFLWIFGDNVEYRLGGLGYLAAYLGTGAVATLSFAVLSAGSMIPLVGASGAISGVLGMYLIWFPHNRVRILMWIFILIQVLHVRAFWVLLFYLLVSNVLPFMGNQGGGGGGVAYAAHIGGFLAGMALAWVLDRFKGRISPPRPDMRTPLRAERPHPANAKVISSPADLFRVAIRDGRMEDAANAFAHLAREGGAKPDPREVFRLAQWLYENHYVTDAAAVFRFYIKSFPRGDDLDRVHLGLGILLSRRLQRPISAREHLLTAIDLATDDAGVADVARAELARIDG